MESKMNIGTQIKKYRTGMGLSQEGLAEKIFVSRQTVSNWETGKNYPDLHSLVLLSSLFNVSLDQLIKGDVEIMKKEIKETEIRKLNMYGKILGGLMAAMIVLAVPLSIWLGMLAVVPWGALFGLTMFFAVKAEQIKKENDIHTYKEIVAFTEGKRLDEIEKQQEIGKRPYQRFLLAVGSALIALLVCMVLGWLFFR